MDNSAGDCSVCSMTFDTALQRPHSLPCGHSFCGPCINRLQERGQVTCPTCRLRHPVPEAGQYPINYALEAFMRSVRETNQNEVRGLSGTLRSLLQEQKTKVQDAICTCQEVEEQLNQYHTTLTGLGDQQQHLENRLQALKDQTHRARVLVHQEEMQVVAKKEQVQQKQQQLQALLEVLNMVATEEEVGASVVDAARGIEEAEQRAQECQEIFPNVDTVITARRVMDASMEVQEVIKTTKAALYNADVSPGATGDSGIPAATGSTIMDRLHTLLEPTQLRAEDLCSLTHAARNLLQDGLVFAIHHVEGQSQHARISLEDDRVYLHSLLNQTPPPRAAIVQIDDLVPADLPCLVFLDVTWPGTSVHRVFIRLNPDTSRGQQFLMSCTGKQGSCYAHKKFIAVHNKGGHGECVFIGNNETNIGGGTALPLLMAAAPLIFMGGPLLGGIILNHLIRNNNQASYQAGSVIVSSRQTSSRGAYFGIMTRDLPDDQYFPDRGVPYTVVGNVMAGLEVVVEAAQLDPIDQVTVVDCGVVLSE